MGTRSRLRTHQTFFAVLALLLGVTVAGSVGFFFLVEHRIALFVQQLLERKSWDVLGAFHERSTVVAGTYLERSLVLVERLAAERALVAAFQRSDLATAREIIERQRRVGNRFESYGVFDATGTLLLISSERPELQQFVGKNFSDRWFFRTVKATQRATIAPVFQESNGHLFLAVAAPIVGDRAQFTHVLVGSLTLSALSERLRTVSAVEPFSVSLVDQNGSLVLQSGRDVTKIENVRDRDPVLSRIFFVSETAADVTVDSQGAQYFTRASKVPVAGREDIWFVVESAYPYTAFRADVLQASAELRRVYGWYVVVFVCFAIIGSFLIVRVVRLHERTAHRR